MLALLGSPPQRKQRTQRRSRFSSRSGPPVLRVLFFLLLSLLTSSASSAQTIPSDRIKVLQAEDRRAPSAADLLTLRTAARGRDSQTARLALRALGRLERPALIPDITPGLRHVLPELRSEAANAIAQAARGWARPSAAGDTAQTPAGAVTPATALATLTERLDDEDEPVVRAAICESVARLPYRTVEQVRLAETALLGEFERADTVADRLGIAKAFEAFVRLTRTVRPIGAGTVAALRELFGMPGPSVSGDGAPAHQPRIDGDPLRDARVRRLSLEALMAADAVDDEIVARGLADADPQVRRLAMLAVSVTGRGAASLALGLEDSSPMVRFEALRGMRERAGEVVCASALSALTDWDPQVGLMAIDVLASCGSSSDAVTRLEAIVNDLSRAGMARGWHRAAHAIVALAMAAPDKSAVALGQFAASSIWQLRMYAARAATTLGDRERLEKLAQDADDNVVEAAIDGLVKTSGHGSDGIYITALSRPGYQAVRAAARALDGSADAAIAVPPLKSALQRLVTENHANSLDARAAIIATLTALGSPPPATKPLPPRPLSAEPVINGEALRRLAAPRARMTIAGVGSFELALFTAEAPATVLHFAELVGSGYYNGLTFHRVVPNFVIQGGSPGANEYIGHPDHMRDEVGLWPHVRGAVGISTRGRDTGDAQIFIDLVDNPRLDHEYTVFAQVLNGIDVVDHILEGDVIERVEIVP